MHILFTGGSSFSGMWFINTLAGFGHKITATLLRPYREYHGIRKERIDLINASATVFDACPFGSDAFIDCIESQSQLDLLCHHAAEVTDYKSFNFDFLEATKKNSFNLERVLQTLEKKGCRQIVLTGSVFEQREGRGSEPLRAVSPYGLSKGLTADIFAFYCQIFKFRLGKFVIPNPFGPFEEMRFTTFLIKEWLQKKSAIVNYPNYLRDNIHIDLLALCYAQFCSGLKEEYQQINPSQYVETQGEFTKRFAEEMRHRLSVPCKFEIAQQIDFSEPLCRYNQDTLNTEELKWNEVEAWNNIATFYLSRLT